MVSRSRIHSATCDELPHNETYCSGKSLILIRYLQYLTLGDHSSGLLLYLGEQLVLRREGEGNFARDVLERLYDVRIVLCCLIL